MANILVTGSSKGIGFETALAFGRAGHQVFATMRNPANAPALAEIATAEKLPIKVSQMDVDSDESVRQGIAQVLEIGPVDVLVNNAGLEGIGSVEESPLSKFRAIMETNYFGALRCTQAVLPTMRRRKSGCIINVSSIAGRFVCPPLTPYNASKFALEALSEALAGEVKESNIRVLIIEPGVINTEMAHRIALPGEASAYGHSARINALFTNALTQSPPPSLVGQKIFEIVESGTWQLRHPVGPDANFFLEFRRRLTDEEWVDLNAGSDAQFFGRLAEEMAKGSNA